MTTPAFPQAMSTSKSKAKKVWVDPESLDVPTGPHNDASSIRGNVPRRLNQMVVNTYIAYGVGDGGSKKDNGNESNTSTNEIQAGGFAGEVGRKVRFVATYIRHRDRSRELNRNGDRVRQNHRRSNSELSGVAVPEIGEEGRVETRAEVGADTDADADRSATPTRASPAPAPADVDVNIDVDDTHTHTSNYSKSGHNSAVAGPLEVTTIAEIVVDNCASSLSSGLLLSSCYRYSLQSLTFLAIVHLNYYYKCNVIRVFGSYAVIL